VGAKHGAQNLSESKTEEADFQDCIDKQSPIMVDDESVELDKEHPVRRTPDQ
jgi:hypothetical protein